ncbi:ABC transporter ATP-binding protein [Denitrobaculum tricleocarpae]|uniref:ABC transporter ATP-binding protein n=1 Tax=Denitrobaculum tricleocarpae TaxID=2591009 RepID=A0A545TMF5_9PROT|nr:ABC transporter ATP-binding protein [Denitrobaculum tricleocarpae]TQV78410.1 ABC transporter ATP-binding protein [Denitrobaculum tricleocarpae]
MSAVLRLEKITKRFGSLVANDGVSLSLARGEVLALLGENGAGKTTLMNILFGHYVADEGQVEVEGKALPPGAPHAAIAAGIGMVHQHFTLADNLTVLDNVVLGTESLWRPWQGRAAARSRLAAMASDFGLSVDPDDLVGDLSVGERQRVEILKALYRDARILIMDEPTAVLTPQEAESLFDTLRRLVERGLSIIFISHKLNEILAISDRVMVLRRGKIVHEMPTESADRHILAEAMVGRAVTRPKADPMEPGQPVLSMTAVSLRPSAGGVALKDVNLKIRAHEVVGIAGVSGNGQVQLAELISGLSRPDSGTLTLFGEIIQQPSPAKVVGLGVGRIPEDRHAEGVIGEMSIWENMISEDLRAKPISNRGLIDHGAARARTEDQIERFDVRCPGPNAETRLLSGGNMQKLILARALSREPGLVLANQPARGLDEGAIAYVHGQLLAARERGAGVLLITEDLEELLALSDRVAVIYHGRLSASLDAKTVSPRELGLMMAGHDPNEDTSGARGSENGGAAA